MTQQTAATLKDAATIVLGAVGTATSGAAATLEAEWGLSDVSMVVSIMTGVATFFFVCSMTWLNIKKGKQFNKTGSTKPGKISR